MSYQSAECARVKAGPISGSPAIGGSEIRFTLEWTVHQRPLPPVVVGHTFAWVSVGTEVNGEFLALGRADPQTALCMESPTHPAREMGVMYRLQLPTPRLLALEQLRQGRELIFRIEVHGICSGEYGPRSLDETLTRRVNASEWADILKQAGFADVVLVGIHLSMSEGITSGATALSAAKQAHAQLQNGNYTAAVAECRAAIESLWQELRIEDVANAARQNLARRDSREAMVKIDRCMAIGEALRAYCHKAIHPTDGLREEFGRSDAAMMVAATIGVIACIAEDPGLAATPR